MKAKEKTPQTKEELLRLKATSYIVCFIDQCPLHEHCLRWQANQYVSTVPFVTKAINPRNPNVGNEQCEMFRDDKRKVMKRGLTHLYDNMSKRTDYAVRHTLIAWWGRKRYFEVRKGDRLITPEMQQDVESACRKCGWTGPIIYDGEQEDWEW